MSVFTGIVLAATTQKLKNIYNNNNYIIYILLINIYSIYIYIHIYTYTFFCLHKCIFKVIFPCQYKLVLDVTEMFKKLTGIIRSYKVQDFLPVW